MQIGEQERVKLMVSRYPPKNSLYLLALVCVLLGKSKEKIAFHLCSQKIKEVES